VGAADDGGLPRRIGTTDRRFVSVVVFRDLTSFTFDEAKEIRSPNQRRVSLTMIRESGSL
jgi:hypothetical protein